MAMVEQELSSLFNVRPQQHQSNGAHHLMDWTSHNRVGSLRHSEEVQPFVGGDMYNPFSLQQSPFDMGDYHHHHKPDTHMSSSDFEYMNVHHLSQQVGSNMRGSHHQSYLGSGNGVMSSGLGFPAPTTTGGGVLEEIDGILRNFEFPSHHQGSLDPLFGDLMSLPQQQGVFSTGPHCGLVSADPFASLSSYSGLSMDGGVDMSSRVDDLAKVLQVEIMSDGSSVGSSLEPCAMASDSTPFSYTTASSAPMHDGYLDAATRGWQKKIPQGMPAAGQPQLVKSANPPQRSSALGGGLGDPYHNVGASTINFQRTAPAYGPSPSPLLGHGIPSNGSHPKLQPKQEVGVLLMNGQQQHAFPDPVSAAGSMGPATGLQLVHWLLECAEHMAEDNIKAAEVILARLRFHVLPDGNPMQRLAAYFQEALHARLTNRVSSPIFKGLTGDRTIPQAEVLEAFSVFYDCIPIGKFGHLTCNQILLDAVEKEREVHVLDLQIWHGMQWPAFLQALALRPGGPPRLRMTALGCNGKDLKETGEKLEECARNLNVPFEFCPITTDLASFDPSTIDQRRNEVLVVNSFVQFHCLLNKGPDQLTNILRGLRRLNPRVVAFAENDGNHNSSQFLQRFMECLRYYSAVFDAFDASLPPDSPARMKMEKIFAAQKIRNIIACEGPARVDGHETMRYWHNRMEAANFRNIHLSSRAVSQANLLLNLYYSNGYTLNTSEYGYLALGWHDMPLMGVSAWS